MTLTIDKLVEVIQETRQDLEACIKEGDEIAAEAAYAKRILLEYALSLVVGHETNTKEFEKIVSGK